ncbi:12883_t:CDS:2 [Entrophospora sp. SA101]|nr:12883_t:CDS:2 [Entrophospora sp. SA101]
MTIGKLDCEYDSKNKITTIIGDPVSIVLRQERETSESNQC